MPDLWITMLKSGSMLILVLAVLLGVLYWVKKILAGQNSLHGHGVIRQIATHHLAPKEKVVLLDVLGQKILIGITAQSISRLGTIDAEFDPASLPETNTGSIFSGILRRSVNKQTAQGPAQTRSSE